MTRRIASKVHHQASRLLQAGLLKSRPPWYQAVMDHPPLPLPPRTPPQRDSYDLPDRMSASHHSSNGRHISSKHQHTPKQRPLPVHYIEDDLRRQFFKDRPFQAYRPVTLVENGAVEEEHAISGRAWTRLRQRGRNPTPEDAVRFAVHLHTVHNRSLAAAYRDSVLQFDALRSEQYIMSAFAALEAEAHGAVFQPGEIERGFQMEDRALESWEESGSTDGDKLVERKRWKAVVERLEPGEWTRGQAYVRLWKAGVRPDYALTSSRPSPPRTVEDQEEKRIGWMGWETPHGAPNVV